MEEILKIFGLLGITALGAVGGIWFFVKVWGQSWIQTRFSKELEHFKAITAHELGVLFARKSKWHDKEYEVLSEGWKKLVKAHTSLLQAIQQLIMPPNFNRMKENDIEEFMDSANFTDEEKKHMRRNTSDYESAYLQIINQRASNDFRQAFTEFHIYFNEHKIFLRPHIKDQFQQADNHIGSAFVNYRTSRDNHLQQSGEHFKYGLEALKIEDEQIKPLVQEIEAVIQKELFPVNEQKNSGA